MSGHTSGLVATEEPLLLTVKQAAAKLNITAWSAYRLLDDGSLKGVYQGRRRYVVASSIPVYIANLPTTPGAKP